MIWRVCPCHGLLVVAKWTHDICQVTREKVEAEERDSAALRRAVLSPRALARPAPTTDGRGDPLG